MALSRAGNHGGTHERATGPASVLPEGCSPATPRRTPSEQYTSPPPATLTPGARYSAELQTSCGALAIDLSSERAHAAVSSFVYLARHGFYDGLPFHRVEKDFVMQTGDPDGRPLHPPDGPGYAVVDSPPSRARRYVYGVVALANLGPSEPNTVSSQFFIVVHDYRGALDGRPEPAGLQARYTIIGRVPRRSWDTLQRIAGVETRGGNDPVRSVEPVTPIVIRSLNVRSSGG